MPSVTIKITGPNISGLPKVDRTTMAALGQLATATINLRIRDGQSTEGKRFKPYSTRKITIRLDSGTAARLKPKGGRLSRSGDSMVFDGGYAEYKKLSRKGGIVGHEVDLTLSGSMLRRLGVKSTTKDSVEVGVSHESATYAGAVDKERPFLSISERELDELADEIADIFFPVKAGRGGSGRGSVRARVR